MTETSVNLTVETAQLHPTTASCLEALEWLHTSRRCHNVLEIGCGSGILSLAAASLWQASVLATDIAPQAVDDTLNHIREHHMHALVTALRSDGFADAAIGKRAPFDLIICNLLAQPIQEWAPQMASHIRADGGLCLLSGLLVWLVPQVEDTYAGFGFHPLHRIERSPWVTYLFEHR